MKKILAAVLALMLALSLCACVMAEEAETMTYADPVILTVEIVEGEGGYSIRERDLMDIDACMFNTNVVVTEAPQTTTEE